MIVTVIVIVILIVIAIIIIIIFSAQIPGSFYFGCDLYSALIPSVAFNGRGKQVTRMLMAKRYVQTSILSSLDL